MVGTLTDKLYVDFINNAIGTDCCKSYSSAIMKNNFDYPIYSIHNYIQEFKSEKIICVDYYIEKN